MSWPLSHEFNEAVQNPRIVFNDPDLKASSPVVNAQGMPLPHSGNFADVYQMHSADGRDWAVKCFTRPVFGMAERYARVSEAIAEANLPFAVDFTYIAEGILVNGAWRPIVKMEWVEGKLLNQVVRDNADRPKVLTNLGILWLKMSKRLRESAITHADLQHGNVMLVPGSRPGAYAMKLIDYDGMYVPALANIPSGESGHSSFQHPARVSTRAYSPDVDRFPQLVVATALKAVLECGVSLWQRYDNGDNMLFTEQDFRNPGDSRVMRELWQTGNPGVQAFVGRLAIAAGRPITQTPWLDEIAPEGEPLPLDDATRREVEAMLGMGFALPGSVSPEPKFEVLAQPPAFGDSQPEATPFPQPKSGVFDKPKSFELLDKPAAAPKITVAEPVLLDLSATAPAVASTAPTAVAEPEPDQEDERVTRVVVVVKDEKEKRRDRDDYDDEEDEDEDERNYRSKWKQKLEPEKSNKKLLLIAVGIPFVLFAIVTAAVAIIMLRGSSKLKTEALAGLTEDTKPQVNPRPIRPNPFTQPQPQPPQPQPQPPQTRTLKPGVRETNPRGGSSAFAKVDYREYREDGAILIGFEIGLSQHIKNDYISYLRPIWLTATGEQFGTAYGRTSNPIVTVKARDGYAVGGIAIANGVRLEGIGILFMKRGEKSLALNDSYVSEWYGNPRAKASGERSRSGGDGDFIVGIHGKRFEDKGGTNYNDAGGIASIGLVLLVKE